MKRSIILFLFISAVSLLVAVLAIVAISDKPKKETSSASTSRLENCVLDTNSGGSITIYCENYK